MAPYGGISTLPIDPYTPHSQPGALNPEAQTLKLGDLHQPVVRSSQFENNFFTDMCSGSEAGSYLRLIDFVYHSTLGLRVIKKKTTSASRSNTEHLTIHPSP